MKLKKEVKLAITAIIALVVLIWGINFLKARAIFDKNNIFYCIYSDVDGLKVSSSVVYRGYTVGQVTAIKFIGERYDEILVEFTVGKNLQIPSNSVAVIQNIDLMGTKAVNLQSGDSGSYAENRDTLQSSMQLGLFQQVNNQLSPLKKKAEVMMSSFDTVLSGVQDILNSKTKGDIEGSFKSIHRTLINVENISNNLDDLVAQQVDNINQILVNMSSVAQTLKQNTGNIERSLSSIADITDSLRAVNMATTVKSLNNVLSRMDSIVHKINVGEGTLGEVVNNAELYYTLVELSDNLNHFLNDFQDNPKKYIRLSVFDFSSAKNKGDNYGIAIYESEKPLEIELDLIKQYPDIVQIRKNGRFFCIIKTYKDMKQANKELNEIRERFKEALVVKIS